MFVRQVKRKCGVRGCKCTDSFAISLTREVGNTIIVCKSCLGKALGAIDEIDPKTRSNVPKIERTEAPALFFNAKALGLAAKAETDTEAPVIPPESEQEQEQSGSVEGEDEEDFENDEIEASDADTEAPVPDEATVFECPKCGKQFGSERGLKAHLKHCNTPTEEA